jgi:predicted amidophosphoribosyltransferase
MTPPADQRPEPLGFGRCRLCPYLQTGTPAICFACARKSMETLKAKGERCPVCDLPFKNGTLACGSPICGWGDRYFEWNHAAAIRSGVLERVVNAYKYENQRAWAIIFARVLVGFLSDERQVFSDFGLIVASPTFVGPGGRDWDHTRTVLLEASELADTEWPFDTAEPAAIVKTAPTERMVGKNWKQRREIAIGPLRDALRVPNPAQTAGKAILVYDGIFTDGQTLNEVARCLILEGGATRVCGVTLMRQPFGRQR